eukprot:CAMPEP_0202710244 /NCGR_PEP_ID=MMETSP1385-20130828/22251_1 /ASSEMBLY_ACC=CAM_ASM_000861 /TAXON_ID=933848 /ORGANISM="Elphidium margaritaceum" /LENGTH=986 /DNA_ID=CAMNT_0049369735 /DNA_START=60 /DNA_END=3020 /DNA_ORIENTATION=-
MLQMSHSKSSFHTLKPNGIAIETSLSELPAKDQAVSDINALDKQRSKSVTKASRSRPKTPNASKLSTRSRRPRRGTAQINALNHRKLKLKPAVSASSPSSSHRPHHSGGCSPRSPDSSIAILHVRKEDRDLSTWTKMEIAEWLQLHWCDAEQKNSDRNNNNNKLLTYINKIKREKKFDGKNLCIMSERDLKILAHRYLGLQKHDTDYDRFLAHMHMLQSTYAHKAREKIRHNSYASVHAANGTGTGTKHTSSSSPSKRANKHVRRHKSTELQEAGRKHFRRLASLPKSSTQLNHKPPRNSPRSPRTYTDNTSGAKTKTKAKTKAKVKVKASGRTVRHRKSITVPKSLSYDLTDVQNTDSVHIAVSNPNNHKLRRKKKSSQHRRHKSGHPLSRTTTTSKKPRSPTPTPPSKNGAKPKQSKQSQSQTQKQSRTSAWPRQRLKHVNENKALSPTTQPRKPKTHNNNNNGKLTVTMIDSNGVVHKNSNTVDNNNHRARHRHKQAAMHVNRSRSSSPNSRTKSPKKPLNQTTTTKHHHKHLKLHIQSTPSKVRRNAVKNIGGKKSRKKPMTPTAASMPLKPPKRLKSQRSISSFNGRTKDDTIRVKTTKKAPRGRPRRTPHHPPVSQQEDAVVLTPGGGGDETDTAHTTQQKKKKKRLSLSKTSPAGSPAHTALSFAALKQMINAEHGGNYDGVTADELMQLISFGHCDEVDTDYDTDTNTNTYLHEHLSDTPSPKTITRRLTSNNSNTSNVSISEPQQQQQEPIHKTKRRHKQKHQKRVGFAEISDSDDMEYDDYYSDDDERYKPLRFGDYGQSFSSPNITQQDDDTTSSMPPTNSLQMSSNVSDSSVHNRHHTTVIPSIFSIDDDVDENDGDAGDSYAKIALSPIITADVLSAENRGLLLNMNRYSMTDESTDEEERASTPVRQTLLAAKRMIERAIQNSPVVAPRSKPIPDFPDHELDGNDSDHILSAPRLSLSDTKLAALDDVGYHE